MLRGYQRKLVMIRTKESSIFESAFFILRSAAVNTAQVEMVAEANKILEECNQPRRKEKRLLFRHMLISSGISFLLGAALVGAVWLVRVM